MIEKIKHVLHNPGIPFIALGGKGFFKWMSDERYVKIAYRLSLGKKLDLADPKRYTEKIQWLKLYDHRPEYVTMVDKCDVKPFVASIIGEEYIIPTLGVWEKFDDIDFASLPNQFVLKCTHDSGGLVICKDKSKFDISSAKKKIETCLKKEYFWQGREWPYKNVHPRIIAEKYMVDSKTNELRDYKFFSFDGEPKALFVASERQTAGTDTKFDFFDMNYNNLHIKSGHENAENPPEKPECFEEMKELAAKLSKGIPQVRVDFYEVDGKVYFGELTFAHHGGVVPFEPDKWDEIFGSWITLPPKSKSSAG